MLSSNDNPISSSLLKSFSLVFILSFSICSTILSQCDPSEIDPCELGANSIIQACYHAQIAKTSIGYSITGEDFAQGGVSNQSSLMNIPSDTYPMPNDVFPIWGAIGGRTQAVFLGSDGDIYAIGDEDLMIDDSHTNGPAWGKTNLSLPYDIEVCDVNKWEGTAGSGSDNMSNNSNSTGDRDGFLVFSTYDGEAYITGDGASVIQVGAKNDDWTKIQLPADIKVKDFAVGYRTLLVLGTNGLLYASGEKTYLGDGSPSFINALTELVNQPDVSIFGISQIQAGYHSYFVLDGDGTIHVLGDNSEGGLGTGDLIDAIFWSKVGQNCSAGVLKNVAYVSTLSTHDYRVNSSAILISGTIRSWGSNSKQAITTGEESLISCPIKPTGNNMNAVAISNGGHISPYVNTNIQICNIGHNKDGAFGDGNDENGDYGEYICNTIPGMPIICGTNKADLELIKTVNETEAFTGDDVVFTLTVTNKGPESSTGSFVREILDTAFYYISDNANGAYDNITGLWIVGPLDVGESASIQITVKLIAAGFHKNYAQIFVDNEVDINSVPGDNSSNQDDDDVVLLNISPCPIERSDILLCPDDSIFINNEWVNEDGLFIESYSLSEECDSLHLITVSFVEEPPYPEMEVDCNFREFNVKVDQNTNWTPSWNNGDNNYITSYDEDNAFAVLTLTREPDCYEEIFIEFPSLPILNDLPYFEDTTLLENTFLPLSLDIDASDWKVQWSPEEMFDCANCPNTLLKGTRETEVKVILDHYSGCSYERGFQLRINKEPQHIYTPNIFSPNNDLLNDEWIVFTSQNILIESCKVYDRWGNMVYSSFDSNPKWNGLFNGKESSQGVYVYLIQYYDRDGIKQIKTGDITLIK